MRIIYKEAEAVLKIVVASIKTSATRLDNPKPKTQNQK